jgi:hypothetical protein
MSRGLFIFFIQMIASLGVTGIGVWAVVRPRHLQQFVNLNFALLPEVKDAVQTTPIILRSLGILAVWYGCTLIGGFLQELSALGFG